MRPFPRRCNGPALAAVTQAARIRLRPVMMTSVATVCGHFPLTLVSGAGGQLLRKCLRRIVTHDERSPRLRRPALPEFVIGSAHEKLQLLTQREVSAFA
jgi:hypothetical protein